MKIQRIEIINFRKIDKMVLDNLQDKNIISFIGKNGTGKTSILKAIEFNLTGNSDDVGITKDKMKVDITYIVNKDNVNVVREKGGIFKVSIQSGNEWVVTDGRKKEVQEYLEKIMGFDTEYFKNIIYFEQMAFQSFVKMKPTEKKEKLRYWLGLEIWDDINERVRDKRKKVLNDISVQKEFLERAESEVENLKQELKDSDEKKINAEIKKIEKEYNRLKELLKKNELSFEKVDKIIEFNDKIKDEMSKLSDQLDDLRYNDKTYKANILRAENTIEKYKNEKCPKCNFPVYSDLIKENNKIKKENIEKFKNNDIKFKEYIKKIDTVQAKLKIVPEKKYEDVSASQIIELKEEMSNLEIQKKDIDYVKKEYNKNLKQQKIGLAEIKKLKKLYKVYDNLSEETGKNGISNWLMAEYLEKLNLYINEILTRLSINLDIIEINLINEGITKTGKATDGFEILIDFKNEEQPRKIESLSGSELTIAIISIRLAMIELRKEISNKNTSFIILDETFGALDEDNKDLALDILNDLSKKFEQILCVSHLELGKVLPNVYEISRDKFTKIKELI